MTIDLKERLDAICQQMNTVGFYVGFYSQEDFAITPNETKRCIENEISFRNYDSVLHSQFTAVNPHLDTTVLYKVDARLFKAFPACGSKALERFFLPSFVFDNINGIVLVSHRLKMLSFLWACYDPIDKDEEHIGLLFNVEKATQWAHLVGLLNDSQSTLGLHHNPLHANYRSAFECRHGSCICPWEVCLSIEDHWKNELLYDKVCMGNEIAQLKSSISSAKHIIESQERKIEEFNNRIDARLRDAEKYKTDIYKFRVDAELQNVN